MELERLSSDVDQQVVGIVKKEPTETQKSNAGYFVFFYGQNNSNACPRKMGLNLGQGAMIGFTLPARAEDAV